MYCDKCGHVGYLLRFYDHDPAQTRTLCDRCWVSFAARAQRSGRAVPNARRIFIRRISRG